ncbi:MAG: SemiSWEET family transporter, partial [Nanoarchaeota archaeon]
MDTWAIIGILGAICITIGWIPEILVGLKKKSLRGVAWWLLLIELAGSLLFLAYGWHLGDSVIIGTNIAASFFL